MGLQLLRIRKCGLGERSAAALGQALMNCSSLEEIDISWNRLGLGGAQALAAGVQLSSQVLAGACGVMRLG